MLGHRFPAAFLRLPRGWSGHGAAPGEHLARLIVELLFASLSLARVFAPSLWAWSSLLRDSKPNQIHQPGGSRMWICSIRIDFLECREKRSEFGLGSTFFGISDLDFLPYGVQIKGVIEKGWIFDEKC